MELRYTLVLLLLFVGLCDHQARAQETPGWSCGDHRFCYQLWNEKVDLDAAKVKCKREGEQARENQEMLACPRNSMDVEQIYKYIKDSREEYWIGAVSLPNSNEWKCADETSSPIGDISWAQGHPKASSLYAFIINGTVISTKEATADLNFICQKKNAAYLSQYPDERKIAHDDISTQLNFIDCGSNTCLHSRASNTNYYYGASGNSNWTEVAKLCTNMNAHLATPSTLKKHQELVAYIRLLPDYISQSNTWIGLYYPKKTGVQRDTLNNRRMGWKWIDNSTYDVSESQWAAFEPIYGERFVRIRNETWFAVFDASDAKYFICEKNCGEPGSNCFGTELSSSAPPQIAISSSGTSTTSPSTDSNDSNDVKFTQNVRACGDLPSWKYSSASNKCYLLDKTRKSESDPALSWQEVKEECERLSGNLVCPSTAAKHEEVVQLIDTEKIITLNVWIGLQCKNNVTRNFMCYEWQWVDGSAYDNNWQKWANNEPGRGETLARIRDEQWYSAIDDRDAEYYICEKGSNCFGTELSSSSPPQTAISSPGTSTTSPSTDSNNSDNVEFIQNVQACGDSTSPWKYSSASNMCYLLEKTHKSESDPVMSWQEVREECERISGNLVCPSTAAKHEEILQLIDMEKIPTLNVWIGLQCKNNVTRNVMCYEWQWVDGSAYDNSWHKWANNEPARGETLARMRDEQWYAAIDARDAEYYICEKGAKWIRLPPPTYSPAMTTSKAACDKNGSEEKDILKLTESKGNLPLLAILTLVLPVVLIPTLVILFRRWKRARNNAEHAASTQDRRNQERNLELKDYEHLKNPFLTTADNSFYASIGYDEYEYIDINAIYSAEIKFGFIPTRTPAVGNAANFWKTAWDNNCDTIIMLCTPDQLGRRLYYPHKDGESCYVTPFLVECNMIKPGKHISCQHLNVTLTGKEIRQFLHVHVLCEDLSAKASEELVEIFLEIYHRVRKRKLQFKKNTPNIVHCLNDAHWTGLFCAFCGVLDQIDLKKEVDISRVWDLLRPSQTQFISSKEQHVKLVEMIFDFIKNQNRYSKILDGKEGFADTSGNGRVKRHYENA